jgi:hypothetical protein
MFWETKQAIMPEEHADKEHSTTNPPALEPNALARLLTPERPSEEIQSMAKEVPCGCITKCATTANAKLCIACLCFRWRDLIWKAGRQSPHVFEKRRSAQRLEAQSDV